MKSENSSNNTQHESSSGILAEAPPPPITAELVGWYTANSLDVASNQWRDLSGGNNHAVIQSGPLTVVRAQPRNGLNFLNWYQEVRGTTASRIVWSTRRLSLTYTLFHVTRYVGPTRGRIFDGYSAGDNWLSGHHGGSSGMAYQQWVGWIASANWHGDNWVVGSRGLRADHCHMHSLLSSRGRMAVELSCSCFGFCDAVA